MIMKYGDKPKRKMKKAARKMGKAARKGALASIVGSAAMKAKKEDAYSSSEESVKPPSRKDAKKLVKSYRKDKSKNYDINTGQEVKPSGRRVMSKRDKSASKKK